MRNILVNYQKKKILDLKQCKTTMNIALELLKNKEYSPNSDGILELSAKSGCTAYDCEYVALAISLQTQLITNDKQILNAFPKTAMKMSEFLMN